MFAGAGNIPQLFIFKTAHFWVIKYSLCIQRFTSDQKAKLFEEYKKLMQMQKSSTETLGNNSPVLFEYPLSPL